MAKKRFNFTRKRRGKTENVGYLDFEAKDEEQRAKLANVLYNLSEACRNGTKRTNARQTLQIS